MLITGAGGGAGGRGAASGGPPARKPGCAGVCQATRVDGLSASFAFTPASTPSVLTSDPESAATSAAATGVGAWWSSSRWRR